VGRTWHTIQFLTSQHHKGRMRVDDTHPASILTQNGILSSFESRMAAPVAVPLAREVQDFVMHWYHQGIHKYEELSGPQKRAGGLLLLFLVLYFLKRLLYNPVGSWTCWRDNKRQDYREIDGKMYYYPAGIEDIYTPRHVNPMFANQPADYSGPTTYGPGYCAEYQNSTRTRYITERGLEAPGYVPTAADYASAPREQLILSCDV
jgi:hypothetical protein